MPKLIDETLTLRATIKACCKRLLESEFDVLGAITDVLREAVAEFKDLQVVDVLQLFDQRKATALLTRTRTKYLQELLLAED